MKKNILLGTVCLVSAACGGRPANENTDRTGSLRPDRVEVLCFHGAQRCATCVAIEKNAIEAMEMHFAEELRDSTVVFSTIDLSEPVNAPLADRYETTWSSLFVVARKDGEESAENLTAFAFATARTAPETFRKGLVETINEMRE